MSGGGGNMERVLRLMAEKVASDVYLSANAPILIKINGQIMQLSDQPLTPAQPRQLLAEVLRGVEGVAFTFFNARDVVRHPLVQRIVLAYERESGDAGPEA